MSEEDRPSHSHAAPMTRRQMLQGACVVAALGIAGCGDIAGNDGGGGGGDDGNGGSGGPGGAGPGGQGGSGSESGGGDGTNRAPEWQPIPDQVWMVGIPVLLDLATFCRDPDGNPLTFSLDQPLPPGLTLAGSVISGVPTAELPTTPFIATADDGM